MSYLIRIEQGGIPQYKYKKRKTLYFSEFIRVKDGINIFQGEFHSTIHDLEGINWISSPELLCDIDAPFTMIKVDKKCKMIYFASSKYGEVQMYYYYQNGELIISDDFWEIVNQLSISFDKLDIESIKEYLPIGYPLFDGTYIKDLHVVNSSMFFQYDWVKDCLSTQQYYVLSVSGTDQSLNKATDELDKKLNEAFKRIYSEVGDVQFATGLSGGLDSRLIPHYAKQNHIKLCSYILGEPRPRYIFLSRDHRNSRKLAAIFGLKHEDCKWSKDVFNDTVYYDIKNSPLSDQQFFKGRSDINFDVLLTGGSGYYVGSRFPANLQELSEEELAFKLIRLFKPVDPYGEKFRIVNAACRILFGREIKRKQNIPWADKFYNVTINQNAIAKIKAFIHERREMGRDNLSIFLDWFDFCGARNMFGGYESLNGRVRAFSIYNPHVVNTVLGWKFDFFEDRRCLKNLILKHVSETVEVKEQKHEGKIGSKSNFFQKLLNGFLFFLFGNGSDIEIYKFKYIKDDFYKTMTNECKWFYNIFDIRNNVNEMMKFNGKRFLMEIWKIKMVIDFIETGEYK